MSDGNPSTMIRRVGSAIELKPLAAWHVLHTKSRQEKAVARALNARGIEHYLPLVTRVAYQSGRRRRVEQPLFSGYVFLHGTREQTFFAVATKRVANVLTVEDQPAFVREIQTIREAIERGADLTPESYLELGRRVRVTAGPFRGLEGLVDGRRTSNRLVLQVDALGRATSFEIDADLLEPVE
jgi:transcriptional antiterminator NusG